MNPDPDPVIEKLVYTAPGNTSRVFKANWQGYEIALKELPYNEKTWNEVQLQAKLSHLNSVCKCYYCRWAEDTGKIQVYMEWVDHDLYAEIQARRSSSNPYTEEQLWSTFRCLIDTFAYAQQIQICHRDIKPQNILVTVDGQIKIADFGCAKEMFGLNASTMLGTPYYFSPEIKRAFKANLFMIPHELDYNPFKSDVYSLGLTFLMMTRLQESTELFDLDNLEATTYQLLTEVKSEGIRDLLWRMLQIDPGSRFDFCQLKTYIDGPTPADTACWVAMTNSNEEQVINNGLSLLFSSGHSLQVSVSKDCVCVVCAGVFSYYPNNEANYYYCSQSCYEKLTYAQAESVRANTSMPLSDPNKLSTQESPGFRCKNREPSTTSVKVQAQTKAATREEGKVDLKSARRSASMKGSLEVVCRRVVNLKTIVSIGKKTLCEFCRSRNSVTQCVKVLSKADEKDRSSVVHNICERCIKEIFSKSSELDYKCPKCSKLFPPAKINEVLKLE